MIYLLALVVLAALVALAWRMLRTNGPAAERRVMGPDDDPEFLQSLGSGHPDGDPEN